MKPVMRLMRLRQCSMDEAAAVASVVIKPISKQAAQTGFFSRNFSICTMKASG